MKINKKGGFTLIELLVVISIIGLLSSVILVATAQARISARDSSRIQFGVQFRTALELYYSDKKSYPVYPYGKSLTDMVTGNNELSKYLKSYPSGFVVSGRDSIYYGTASNYEIMLALEGKNGKVTSCNTTDYNTFNLVNLGKSACIGNNPASPIISNGDPQSLSIIVNGTSYPSGSFVHLDGDENTTEFSLSWSSNNLCTYGDAAGNWSGNVSLYDNEVSIIIDRYASSLISGDYFSVNCGSGGSGGVTIYLH